MKPNPQWPTELQRMLETIIAAHVRNGVESSAAAVLARQAVEALVWQMGGEKLYLPKPGFLARAARDAEIWGEYNYKRVDVARLAAKHGLKKPQIYAIIAEQRAQEKPNGIPSPVVKS